MASHQARFPLVPGIAGRRRWFIALFLVALASVGAGIVIFVSQRGSSRLVSDLSSQFMEEVASGTKARTLAYLSAGPSSLEAVSRLAARGELDPRDDESMERLFRALLFDHDEIEMFNLGRPDGSFLMVKRMPDGTMSTKRIERAGGIAVSTWRHDEPAWADEEPYADRREPADEAYDPRVRPWYQQAAATGRLLWTEPYVFYSDRAPGIACARPLLDAAGELRAVVGADMGIASLSLHLGRLRIGDSGQAVLLTGDGRLIAYPGFGRDDTEIVEEVGTFENPRLVLRSVSSWSDSVLADAFARWPRSRGAGGEAYTFDHGGQGYVAWFESFPVGSGQSWLVGVLVPQRDFLGSLEREHRISLAVTLLCLFLAIALAALAMRRGAAVELALLELRNAEKQAFIDELEAKAAEMERFTYSVSHDLKSPMVTVRRFAGLLKRDVAAGNTERLELGLSRIDAAVERLMAMLEEVLALARLGRVVSDPRPVSLTEIAGETAEQLAGVIETSGVELLIEPTLPTVLGDAGRLRQVLQNLVENAIKFMGDQPAPRIEIGFRDEPDQGVIFVRDNGGGIAPEHRERIFDLFDRESSRVEGSGIGLASVKRIVEVHGGRIWAQSPGLGQGTTFCFTLPLADPARPAG